MGIIRKVEGRDRAGLALGAALMLCGAGLVAASVPRTVASVERAAAEPLLDRARSGHALTDNERTRLLDGLETAEAWAGDPDARARIGMVRLGLGGEKGTTPTSADYAAAAADLRESLRAAPVNGVAWAQLGYALRALGENREAATALRLSMQVAPFEPTLLRWRCESGFQLFPWLDGGGRELLYRQVQFLWRRAPSDLVDAAIRFDGTQIVRLALARDVDALTGFERTLGARARRPSRS